MNNLAGLFASYHRRYRQVGTALQESLVTTSAGWLELAHELQVFDTSN